MGESNGSVYVDIERISFGGKDHHVLTRHGPISVAVYGDLEKPALVTYPDVALHYIPCFQGLFFCPEASALLLHNFCIYHINPPGHEFDAAPICSHDSVLSVDQLADQVADVLDFFELGSVLCLGVTAGACMLSLFATRYRERVLGLVLVSPLCKAPSWTEWFYNKDIRGSSHIPESDIVQACRSSMNQRYDFTEALKLLHCRTPVFVGENSPFHSEALTR